MTGPSIRCAGMICGLLLLTISAEAQVVRQLTDVKIDGFFGAAVDDVGDVIFTVSRADTFGTNPEHSFQLVKWTYPGPVASQVGDFADGVGTSVSVTDDGTKVVFVSPSDPLGTNHDGSLELFSMMADGTGLVRLTSDPAPNAGSVHSAIIAGSGNLVLFLADTDRPGTNPDHLDQLFVVDTTTLNVTQLTTAASGEFDGFSIDDNGKQVVFAHDGDLAGDNADGSFEIFMVQLPSLVLSQLTDSQASSRDPVISGNGSQITFNVDGGGLFVMTLGGAPLPLSDNGSNASITDDGQWVYYEFPDETSGIHEIGVIHSSGGATVQLTSSSDTIWNSDPVVSGDNSRVVFRARGGKYPGGNNPDDSWELILMDADGTDMEQLTLNGAFGSTFEEADITPDGSRIVFRRGGGIYRVNADGSDLFDVTGGASLGPSVAADGGTIVFSDLSQVYQVQSDGTGLIQLTPGTCDTSRWSDIADDGNVIVFTSACDLAGQNPEGYYELFAVPPGGGTFSQVTDGDYGLFKIPRLSENGDWVAYHSGSNTDGLNPDRGMEVLRARVDGTVVDRVTADPDHDSGWPDISGDGHRVAYVSEADPLGTNADHNYEVFVYDAGTATTLQLTDTSKGRAWAPRITRDGAFVYFLAGESPFESGPEHPLDVYRVAVGTGVIEHAGGLRDPRTDLHRALAVSGTGSRAVFLGPANPTDENLDLSGELWFVDLTTPAAIRVGKTTPTLVTWDVEPRPLRYDVIRGDVADLQAGPANTVDLGAVVCLEDDSPDATTLGFEDPDEPVPGQVFFFLYRGSQGVDDGPGSWGQGTGDAERIAGAGSCLP